MAIWDMSVEETTNNIAPLRIDKFEFFKFVLNKIDITPTNFCVKNGWSLSAFKGWKQGGVPKRAWGVLEKEIKLINLTNFHRRYKEDVFFLQELQDEYIQIKETTN